MGAMGRKRIRDKHLPRGVTLRHGAYYFAPKPSERDRFGGKYLIHLGRDLAVAMARYAEVVESRPARGTLADIWADYLVHIQAVDRRTGRPRNAARTIKDKAEYWRTLSPVFGHCGPNDVESRHVAGYLAKRERDGAGVSGNKEIAALSALYSFAIRRGDRIDRNPCKGVPRNSTGARDVDVTLADLIAWKEQAPPLLALAAEFMFMTGLRSPDALAVRSADLGADGIAGRAGKTGKRFLIPWTPDLREIVREIRALRRRPDGTTIHSEFLFCTTTRRGGRPIGSQITKAGFDSIWQRAAREFEKAGGRRFAPNDCRAAHASALEDQGGDATRNLQHSTRQVTARHYLRRPTKVVALDRA